MHDSDAFLSPEHQATLLAVARLAIDHQLRQPRPLAIDPAAYPDPLRVPRPVFVTLRLDDELRGCIGTLESDLPLVANVARYAGLAAFQDSRFAPVTHAELPRLQIHISILGPLEPLACASEADLLAAVRPGVDGLLLAEGPHRGTLLPSVWEDIPDPREFVRRLKLKAGLSADHWSDALRVHRYTAFCFGDPC